MNLMTPELEQKLSRFPIDSQKDKKEAAEVIVKYYNPCGAGTWLITEGQKLDDGDWLLFGKCCLFEWEWKYVTLSELEGIKLPFGRTIEPAVCVRGTVKELTEFGKEFTLEQIKDLVYTQKENDRVILPIKCVYTLIEKAEQGE